MTDSPTEWLERALEDPEGRELVEKILQRKKETDHVRDA